MVVIDWNNNVCSRWLCHNLWRRKLRDGLATQLVAKRRWCNTAPINILLLPHVTCRDWNCMS